MEIGEVLSVAIQQGHPLLFGTLTMRHHRGQSLGLLWGAGQKAWSRVMGGKSGLSRDPRVLGVVRVWEVTVGERNGWHVHVHFVVVLAPGVEDGRGLFDGVFSRWGRGLVAAGLQAPTVRGQDMQVVRGDDAARHLGRYLTKFDVDPLDPSGLGLELAYSLPGRTSAGLATVPPVQLLMHLMHTGDAEALDLWHEWERGSKGKRMIGWSRGLRARFGVTETERTDEEVVQEQVGTVEDDRLRFTEDGWYRLCSHPERYADLQTIAEVEGVLAAAERCLAWGVEYSLV